MATPARASAHAPSLPQSSETASAESLALQACDDIDNLQIVRRAYTCLEKLIAPQYVNDTEEVCATRSEFSVLVRLVNQELQRSIEAADVTVQSLRVALSEGGRNETLRREGQTEFDFCIGRSRCHLSRVVPRRGNSKVWRFFDQVQLHRDRALKRSDRGSVLRDDRCFGLFGAELTPGSTASATAEPDWSTGCIS